MRGLKGRVALVTGATGLLGSAIATRFAEEEAEVVVTSRELTKAKRWVEQHKTSQGGFFPLQLDLGDPQSIRSSLSVIADGTGIPTVIIANASLRDGLAKPLKEVSVESFLRIFEADIAGHFLLFREVVERLRADQPASIVFISSIYGLVGVDPGLYPQGMLPAPVHYATVKGAALSMTRWLAGCWGERDVRVNAVVAGGIASPARQPEEFVHNYARKTMLGRLAKAEEVASAVAFLASDEASYVTGQCLVVDGGFTAW